MGTCRQKMSSQTPHFFATLKSMSTTSKTVVLLIAIQGNTDTHASFIRNEKKTLSFLIMLDIVVTVLQILIILFSDWTVRCKKKKKKIQLLLCIYIRFSNFVLRLAHFLIIAGVGTHAQSLQCVFHLDDAFLALCSLPFGAD